MANAFSKEEIVAFEEMLQGFEDALVMSKLANVYNADSSTMERANDTIWRPVPFIAQSYDGSDATSNFGDNTELSVPASIGYQKHSTAALTAKELRDMLKEGRLGKAAMQKLASDINLSMATVAANQGTVVVTKSGAASGYADIAAAEEAFNRVGVSMFDRYLALSSKDYNGLAADIAGRATPNQLVRDAYSKSLIGMDIAGFQTHKLDYANRTTAAAGVGVTIAAADQYYTPKATSTASTGEVGNVDNRYQTISIAVTSGTVAVGDSFTIAGVNEVHHITKEDTGELKTFRIVEIVTGSGGTGTVKISPAIISGGGGTDAELQYQNVSATPANGAAITFLNTTAANINTFWHKDALEIIPGRLSIDPEAGAKVLRATLENGIEVVMQKQFDINTQKTKYRWDVLYGVVNKQPEMSGVLLFGQA